MAAGVTLQSADYRAAKADLFGQDAREAMAQEWGKRVLAEAANPTPPTEGGGQPDTSSTLAPVAQAGAAAVPSPAQIYRNQAAENWANQVQGLLPKDNPPATPDLAAASAPAASAPPAPAAEPPAPPTSAPAPPAASDMPANPVADQTLPPPAPAPAANQPISNAPGLAIPDWLHGLIQQFAPQALANDPHFIATVAAGAKAESGWNPQSVQQGGGGRGLFQFDVNGGMGTGLSPGQLFSAEYQASKIIPLYASAYAQAPQNLSPAEQASWVAAHAERPYDYQNPGSTARRNYATAYSEITGGGAATPPGGGGAVSPAPAGDTPPVTGSPPPSNPLQGLGDAVGGAASAVGQKVQGLAGWLSQLGRDPTEGELGQFLQIAHQAATPTLSNAGATGTPLDALATASAAVPPEVQRMLKSPLQTMAELSQKYPSNAIGQLDTSQMTPEDRAAYDNLGLAVGGVTMGGGDALSKAQQAVNDLRVRFPQMSEGSLAASGPGKTLAALQAEAARANPAGMLDWNRSRANLADQAAADAGVPGGRAGRLNASDAYGGAEPPAMGDQFTRDPQGNIVPLTTDQQAMQQWIQTARAAGVDTSRVEAQMRPTATGLEPTVTTPAEAPPPTGVPPTGNELLGPSGPQPGQFGLGGAFGDNTLPYGGVRPGGMEPLGPAGPQPGQLGFAGDLPYGGPPPIGNEALGPAGPMRGQMQMGSELPVGGPRPTGTEPLASGAQPGQLQFGSPLPLGGARPTGTEALAEGAQPGQMQFGSPLPVGGPAPPAGGFAGPAGAIENAVKGTQPVLPGFPSPVINANIGDMLNQAHRGNVISGLGTITHVVGNTIISPVWSTVVHNAADIAGGVAGALTGGRVGLAPGEAIGSIAGRSIGATTALVNMGQGFIEAYIKHMQNPTAGGKPIGQAAARYFFEAQNAVGSGLHAALMNATKQGIEHIEITAAAGQQAASEGLTGSAFTSRMGELVADPSQLPARMLALAKDRATRGSLQGEAGGAQTLMQNIAKVPVLGNTLFPVVRIASQALAQTIEKSPVGLLGTAADVGLSRFGVGPYAKGFSQTGGAVTPLGDRLINNIGGTAVTAFMVQKALDGTITGNGPADPNQLALLKAQGWQPNSVYVPGRGYVDYHALPVAGALAQAAAIGDALQFAGPQATTSDQVLHGTVSLAKYVVTNTGLQTIGDVITIMQGGAGAEKAVASFAGNTAGGFVPFSGLGKSLTVGADTGPARKPDLNVEPGQDTMNSFLSGAGQTIEQNLPGLRQNVPLAQDVLGRNEANPAAGLGAFLPQTGKGSANPVLAAFTAAGATIPPPVKSLTVGTVPVQLTTEEQRQYQQTRGQLLEQEAQKVIADPRYVSASQPEQRYVLEHLLAAVDQAATRLILAGMSRDQVAQRFATGQQAATQRHVPMSIPQYVTTR